MKNLFLMIGLYCGMATGAAACSATPDFFNDSDAETLIGCMEGEESARFLTSRNTEFATVLHLAVSQGADLRVFDAMRRTTADTEEWPDLRDRLDNEGRTALHLAVTGEPRADLVRWLLFWGADPNALFATEPRTNPLRFDFGVTALHLAVERSDNAEVVSALLAGGADPDIQRPPGDIGWMAVHVATRHAEDTRVLTALAAGGVDLTTEDNDGNTVLHIASAWDRSPEVTEFLLEAGADANATNDDSHLALHLAARFASNPSVVEILLDATETPCAEDDAGRTPGQLLTAGNEILGENQELRRRFHEICVEGD